MNWPGADLAEVSAGIAFVALFITSIFQLTAIQHRVLAAHGWDAFSKRKVKWSDMYWRTLSIAQRLRLWLGLGMFLVIVLVMSIMSWVHPVKS